jgi:hypothetical protein
MLEKIAVDSARIQALSVSSPFCQMIAGAALFVAGAERVRCQSIPMICP